MMEYELIIIKSDYNKEWLGTRPFAYTYTFKDVNEAYSTCERWSKSGPLKAEVREVINAKYECIRISTPFDDEKEGIGKRETRMSGQPLSNINRAYQKAEQWNICGPRQCEVREVVE